MDLYIPHQQPPVGPVRPGRDHHRGVDPGAFPAVPGGGGGSGPGPGGCEPAVPESLGSHSYLLDGAEALCRESFPYCKQYIVTNGIKVAQVGRLNTSPIRPYIERCTSRGRWASASPGRFFPDRLRRPGDDARQWEADGDCGRQPGLGHFGRAQRPRGHHLVQPGGKGKSDRYYPPPWEAADFPAVGRSSWGKCRGKLDQNQAFRRPFSRK